MFDSLAPFFFSAQSWKCEGGAAWFPAGQLASHRKPAEEAEGRAPAALGAGARCSVGGAARSGGRGHRVGERAEAGGLGQRWRQEARHGARVRGGAGGHRVR